MKSLLQLLGLVSVGLAAKIDYTGHELFHVTAPTDSCHDALLKERMSPTMDLHFLTEGLRETDIVVSPSEREQFLKLLKANNATYTITTDNVQDDFDRQILNRKGYTRGNLENFDYNEYHTYEEIIAWMRDIHEAYPILTELTTMGTSYEGRELLGIKITGPHTGEKKTVFTNYAIHAREWLSPATGINMIHMLLSQYAVNAEVEFLVNSLNWVFLPVTNPDGYVYTWTDNRLWRKTRSINPSSNCIGVDPNRNWANHWGYPGASTDPCSDSYMGRSAFSEIEVKSVADEIERFNSQGYIDFHCCGEMWMTPWGWTTDYPADYERQYAAAERSVDAIRAVDGTRYAYGTISRVIYVASGSSVDYAYGDLGVVQSVAVELPGSFTSPPSIIEPTAKETFPALLQFGFVVLNGN